MIRSAILFGLVVCAPLALYYESDLPGRAVSDQEASQVSGGCGDFMANENNVCDQATTCDMSTGTIIEGTGDYKTKSVTCGAGCTKPTHQSCSA